MHISDLIEREDDINDELRSKGLLENAPELMSSCCSADYYDPSGEDIEGRCKDCGEMCGIVEAE